MPQNGCYPVYFPGSMSTYTQTWRCRYCGQEFVPKKRSPAHLERNPPAYCSWACLGADRRQLAAQHPHPFPVRVCQQCGREFRQTDHPDRQVQKYCSRECRAASQQRRVTLVCRQCGRVFQRKRYQRDYSTQQGPFCRMACYGRWQHENLRGQRPANRDRPSRSGAAWQEIRPLVLERDGHRCRECGATEQLHVHHVRKWQPGDLHEQDNLVTVCEPCHRRLHLAPRGPASPTG